MHIDRGRAFTNEVMSSSPFKGNARSLRKIKHHTTLFSLTAVNTRMAPPPAPFEAKFLKTPNNQYFINVASLRTVLGRQRR